MIPEWSGFMLRLRLRSFRFIIYDSEGRFTNRPYNDNGISTSGEYRSKSGQPHGIAPTLGELENWKEKGKVLKFIVVGLIWGDYCSEIVS
jgi:hypothetical protein